MRRTKKKTNLDVQKLKGAQNRKTAGLHD